MYYTFKVCFHAKTKLKSHKSKARRIPSMVKTALTQNHPGFLIFSLAAITISTSLAIDLCLPALPFIAESLVTDMGRVQQILSVFILGVGFGQLVYGPLSDSLGRKPVLIFGLALYGLAGFLCALAQSVDQLIVFRLMQSFGAAVGAVVTRAVVRDLYQGEQAAKVFSSIFLVMMLAPLIAPLLSAQLLLWVSWRFIFILLGAFGLLLVASVVYQLPETLSKNRHCKLSLTSLPGQYWAVLADRRTAGYFLCGSFTFAGMFAFVTSAPFVYMQYYNVPLGHFGFWYSSNILMVSLLSWINGRVIERVGLQGMLDFSTWLSMLAGMAVLFFAVTGIGGLLGIYPGLLVFIGSLGMIGANCNAGMLDPFGDSAGMASAIMGAGRFLFGGLASMIVGILHDGTPLPMAVVIFGSSVLAFLSYRIFVIREQPA
jgi:DHA1 family bicyclomycin/chloramphenicol resistance-like MFS transporter